MCIHMEVPLFMVLLDQDVETRPGGRLANWPVCFHQLFSVIEKDELVCFLISAQDL